jgi:hypothetical protein
MQAYRCTRNDLYRPNDAGEWLAVLRGIWESHVLGLSIQRLDTLTRGFRRQYASNITKRAEESAQNYQRRFLKFIKYTSSALTGYVLCLFPIQD